MNIELRLLLTITHHLPRFKGAGYLANQLKAIYNRKSRSNEIVSFRDIKMDLETKECVDGGILFYPQLYDWQEMDYIRKNLQIGARFADLGANIGWYSLHVSQVVGVEGKVIAIEMDSYNVKKLHHNIALNGIDNIQVIQVGLSDCDETLRARVNLAGNRGGTTLINAAQKGAVVICKPLLSILNASGWGKLDGLKIDIEGMETRVMSTFFEHAPKSLYPKFMIVEMNAGHDTTELHELFLSYGYKMEHKISMNSIYRLGDVDEK